MENIKSDFRYKINGKCKIPKKKKLKNQKIKVPIRRVLIVENMQNCFFSGGSMGFVKRGDDLKFIKKVNKLIAFFTNNKKYDNAGKTGNPKEASMLNTSRQVKGIKDSGSRKKYFFDLIIYTLDINPPDFYGFQSYHFLRDKSTFYSDQKEKKKIKGDGKHFPKDKSFLGTPDYALTDGSDSFLKDGKQVMGVNFVPELNMEPLQRPNKGITNDVYINEPIMSNRGFIVTKNNNGVIGHSAFRDSMSNKTGLADYLECNGINSVYVCGMGRENNVIKTAIDASKLKFIEESNIVYDATMPIAVLKPKNMDVMKDNLENTWVKSKSKTINFIELDFLERDLRKAKTKFDKDIQKSGFGKSLKGFSKLFQGATEDIQEEIGNDFKASEMKGKKEGVKPNPSVKANNGVKANPSVKANNGVKIKTVNKNTNTGTPKNKTKKSNSMK